MPAFPTVQRSHARWPYIQIARMDHWCKNSFMLLGVLLALFYEPTLLTWTSGLRLGLAVLATCLIASSNYVLNEILDAPQDRFHPVKQHRPVPSGLIRPPVAVLEWLLLGATGVTVACLLNASFAASGCALWGMGIVYNVPPLRTKELPYLDVLSEAVNNPLRLFLGWFALVPDTLPPLSLTLAYWMLGAFFMATKRFAEYRQIGNPAVAARYRQSFGHYTEERLLASMFFYAVTCGLFLGAFMMRYHVEIILFIPMAAGFLVYYLHLGLQDNSPVQYPEQLYKQRGFLLYALVSVIVFVLLMFTSIPELYALFHIAPAPLAPLWRLGA